LNNSFDFFNIVSRKFAREIWYPARDGRAFADEVLQMLDVRLTDLGQVRNVATRRFAIVLTVFASIGIECND
jgi:hypothetical protein